MARRKRQEEHVNHERWLVSYADFITLLFAFFVVMYAVSSVNEGKYRVLSDTIEAAFKSEKGFEEEERALQPIQIGEPGTEARTEPMDLEQKPTEAESLLPDRQVLEHAAQVVDTMADELQQTLMPQIQDDLVDVRRNKLWLEVEIKSSLLFPSGSARISREALPVLRRIAEVLRPFPNRIHVEGFTDNVPIHNPVYPSNWELSAARAASVVRLLSRYGLDPQKMAAIGYGEYRPVADNSTPEGRRRNRRVVLVVLPASSQRGSEGPEVLREDLKLQQAGEALQRTIEALPSEGGR